MTDQISRIRDLRVPVNEVRCAGGGARSRFWRQLQANRNGAKTVTVDTENASAFGAALLAGVGARVWDSVESACDSMIHVKEELLPQKRLAGFYRQRHAVFVDLYAALHRHSLESRSERRQTVIKRSYEEAANEFHKPKAPRGCETNEIPGSGA